MITKSTRDIDQPLQSLYFPDQIFIFGGGRWARVIAGVLCDILPTSVPLTMCSPRGANAVSDWVVKNRLQQRVSVEDRWPEIFPYGTSAVIVVNAAHDHVSAARWALQRGATVLVEKPLAMSSQEVQALISFANSSGGLLAAAHVLRFTRYISNFSHFISRLDKIVSVSFEWVDPIDESRYGETKHYDSRVPVYIDCLPHAVSVLQSLFCEIPELAGIPTVEAGGAKVAIPMSLGGFSCNVTLQRNGTHRLRQLIVEMEDDVAILNFSSEPGVIKVGNMEFDADPMWNKAPGPLASLLGAFLSVAAGKKADYRLSLDTAVKASSIADAVTPFYQKILFSWLVNRLISEMDTDDDVYYAVTELFHSDDGVDNENQDFQYKLDILRQRVRNACPDLMVSKMTTDQIRHLLS